jgi:excisionase family DNA binding protein
VIPPRLARYWSRDCNGFTPTVISLFSDSFSTTGKALNNMNDKPLSFRPEGNGTSQKAPDEPLLTTEDVSKWLGIARRTVCLWAECSTLPAIKVGKQWRFRRSTVARWLEQSQPDPFGNNRPTAFAAAAYAIPSRKRLQ